MLRPAVVYFTIANSSLRMCATIHTMSIPSPRHSSFLSLYLAAFVSIMSFSMVFPLLPIYAKTFDASTLVIGLLASSFALAQLLFSPFWGKISDRFGRKPILAVGLLGMSVSFFFFGLAGNLSVLFILRFFQGIFAGAVFPSTRAYIADCTTKEDRAKHLGRVGAAMALGAVFGPAIGGVLAHESISLPFFIASLIAFLNFIYIARFLPESLKEKSKNIAYREAAFNITQLWRGLTGPLAPLFLLVFAWSFAMSNTQVSVPLLGLEKFHMSTLEIGLLFTVLGGVIAFTQALLLPMILKFATRRAAVVVGLLIMSLGFGSMPFLPGMELVYVSMGIAAFGAALSRPLLSALVSEETHEEQGATMGATGAFENMGRLTGPMLSGLFLGIAFVIPFFASVGIVLCVLSFVIFKMGFLKVNQG